MQFRKCVGPLVLMGLLMGPLTACGSRTDGGGFHPSGGQAPADDSSTASAAGTTGPAGSSGDAPGAGAPAPKTPQSAMAAYRGFQVAYEAAYENNDVSALRAVAMDPLLAKISQDINNVRSQGIIWRFHSVLNPQVQGGSADGSSVVILDCVKTLGSFKFDAKTGRRIGSWRGGTAEYQAIMRYADGIWKISDATEGGKC